MSIQQLPNGVIKLISSSQVINSISSVVKELFENSIDAGASAIDVKLERNGLDRIEVRDNGSGISTTDIRYVCLPNHTSKIHNFEDLERLQSYGFRGEALHSLCSVSQISITTRTEEDEVAFTYTYDNNGTIRNTKPSHQMPGATITVTNLFKNVPVRKQLYENSRKGAEELKKIEKIVKHLSIVHPKLRVTLAHNKCLIWHKTSVHSLRQSLAQVYSHAILKNLEDVSCSLENISLEMLIAKRECNLSVLCQPTSEAILFYVNRRPVKDKKVEKVIFEEMTHLYASTLPTNKYPLTLICLKLSPDSVDVNLEPNKTKVFIRDHEEILKQIREQIMLHFYHNRCSDQDSVEVLLLSKNELRNPPQKRRFQDRDEESRDDDCIQFDSNVSEMRNLIMEKTKVNAEEALKELADINFSEFDENINASIISNATATRKSVEKLVQNVKITQQQKNNCRHGNASTTVCGTGLFENVSSLSSLKSSGSSSNVTRAFEQMSADENIVDRDRSIVPVKLENKSKNNNQVDSEKSNVTSMENDPKSSVGNINLSQWSRGDAFINDEPLEGGITLLPVKCTEENCTSSTKTAICAKDDEVPQHHDVNRRSFSWQTALENTATAGFNNLSRQIRSEIIEDSSQMSFTKVAHKLANRWRNLHEKRENVYKEETKFKQKSITTDLRIIFKKKTLTLAVSENKILEELKIPDNLCQRFSENRIHLIGPLGKGKIWLYKICSDIQAVNVSHLRENVLYHRYICNSAIPRKILAQPIKITTKIVGDDLWNYLLSLPRYSEGDDECKKFISDNRIFKNGFKIFVTKEFGFDGVEIFITETPKEEDFDIIENFIETLKLAMQFKELEQCRCAAIRTLLLNKVTEVCEQKSTPDEVTEIRMLLQYWIQCMSQKKICSHDDLISINLHRL